MIYLNNISMTSLPKHRQVNQKEHTLLGKNQTMLNVSHSSQNARNRSLFCLRNCESLKPTKRSCRKHTEKQFKVLLKEYLNKIGKQIYKNSKNNQQTAFKIPMLNFDLKDLINTIKILAMKQVNATKAHCKFCFDVLLAKLKGGQKPSWPKQLPDASTPIFITWKINGNLRGCIGTFSPDNHSRLIPEYAITAAMKDPRFDPMTMNEVSEKLSVNVSLLVNFEDGKDIYDWEVGKHGIIIKASYKQRQYSGTFLPEVASEQGWDKQETLKHLIRKAGFFGTLAQIESHIKLSRYQSSKQSLSFAEYLTL